MKIKIIIILLFLSLKTYAGGWVIIGEYWEVKPFVPYEYSIDHITGLSLNSSQRKYTWKVTNGKMRDQNGNYTLTTLETDAVEYYHPVSIIWDCTENGNIEILEMDISKYVYITPCNVTIDNRLYTYDTSENEAYLNIKNVEVRRMTSVNFNGYFSVRILPGFIAEQGSRVRIYNEFLSAPPLLTRNSITGINSDMRELDYNKQKLFQNTPNPAYLKTTISFIIPEVRKSAYLQFYNMMGISVMKIPITSIGQNSIGINITELTNGVYMYSLIVDDYLIDTKRMVVAN